MKTALMITTACLLSANAFAWSAEKKADMSAINSACSSDAVAANCEGKVDKSLLSCLSNYKDAHSDFVLTDDCMAAKKQLRADKRAEIKKHEVEDEE